VITGCSKPPSPALLHLLARNHVLIDGNRRLGLAAVIAFCDMSGRGP
jgi:death-on-curing protein